MRNLITNLITALALAVFFTNATVAAAQQQSQAQKKKANYSSQNNKIVQGQFSQKIDDYLNRTVPFGFSGAVLSLKTIRSFCLTVTGWRIVNGGFPLPRTPFFISAR
jgi:Na+-translocating ferredoxin:NAD+ oxidoreductase RnfG subunit